MLKHQDKMKDFNHLDKTGLKGLLVEKKDKLRQFRFDLAAGKVKNVREIRETRRDIARLNTLLNKGMSIK